MNRYIIVLLVLAALAVQGLLLWGAYSTGYRAGYDDGQISVLQVVVYRLGNKDCEDTIYDANWDVGDAQVKKEKKP